jgi:sigma-E factor negative regulatory protein RseB
VCGGIITCAHDADAQPAHSAMAHGATASSLSAAQWLDRIREAAQQQNYEGIFVYQRGAFVQSSRIAHYANRADGEYEQVESLDGQPRRMLRHNDVLYTFVPERHLCVVEKRLNRNAFPALLSTGGNQVLTVYALKLHGISRVAGMRSQMIDLLPRDGYRFAYRLYVDARSGLLLREQTLDANGQVLEQLAFSQVHIGGPVNRTPIINGIRNATGKAGWTVVSSPVAPVNIEAQGWALPAAVPGFHKIRELRRPMAAQDAGVPPVPVDQAVFSDGIAAVSIFIEPAVHNSRKEGTGNNGATHMLVTRRAGNWLTLMGEVPQLTLQKFAAAIEYKPAR